MIPDLAHKTLSLIRFDGSVQIWTEDNWRIRFGGDPVVSVPGLEPVLVDPGDPPDLGAGETYPSIPEMLKRFVGMTIQDVTVSLDGHLTMTFIDGSQWSVQADAAYEAWEIHGPRGDLVVCQAGGELAIWGPRAE